MSFEAEVSSSDPWSRELEAAHRIAQVVGLALGFGTPLVVSGLLLARVFPPGQNLAPEMIQQVGYLFTGLVFLAAAWSFWRSGRVLAGFQKVEPQRRPVLLLRESLLYAALSEVSCLLGLIYWVLVGEPGTRYVWGFILLTPLLFLGVVPRKARWRRALEG